MQLHENLPYVRFRVPSGPYFSKPKPLQSIFALVPARNPLPEHPTGGRSTFTSVGSCYHDKIFNSPRVTWFLSNPAVAILDAGRINCLGEYCS